MRKWFIPTPLKFEEDQPKIRIDEKSPVEFVGFFANNGNFIPSEPGGRGAQYLTFVWVVPHDATFLTEDYLPEHRKPIELKAGSILTGAICNRTFGFSLAQQKADPWKGGGCRERTVGSNQARVLVEV